MHIFWHSLQKKWLCCPYLSSISPDFMEIAAHNLILQVPRLFNGREFFHWYNLFQNLFELHLEAMHFYTIMVVPIDLMILFSLNSWNFLTLSFCLCCPGYRNYLFDRWCFPLWLQNGRQLASSNTYSIGYLWIFLFLSEWYRLHFSISSQ